MTPLERLLGEGDACAARRTFALYLMFIAVIVTVVVSYAQLLLASMFRGYTVDADSTLAVLSSVKWMAAVMVPATFIAAVAAYMRPGSKRRLIARLVSSAYLIIMVLAMSHMVEYGVSDVLVNETYGVYVRSLVATLDLTLLMLVLATIPAFSAADAVLEYFQKSDADPLVADDPLQRRDGRQRGQV